MAERPGSGHVERRLQRIGEESAHVRHQIRRLHDELKVERSGSETARGRWDSRTGDLFAWAAKQRKFEQTGSISVRTSRDGDPGRGTRTSSMFRDRDPRLMVYLNSGSFGRLTPLRETDDVLRNRILFTVIVGLVVGYVAYRIAAH